MSLRFHNVLALVPALALVSLVACALESSESESEEDTDSNEEAVTYSSAYPTATTSTSAKPPADLCAGKDAECIDKGTENKLCGTHVSKAQCDGDSDCTWCAAKTK